jgi:hypothetical protein
VFVGFEVDSRFWMNFELGSRTTHLIGADKVLVLSFNKFIFCRN